MAAFEASAPPQTQAQAPQPSAATLQKNEHPEGENTQSPVDPLGRFMRIQDVAASVGLSRATVYRLIREPHDPFPAPIKIGGASIWIEREVAAWKARQAATQRSERQ